MRAWVCVGVGVCLCVCVGGGGEGGYGGGGGMCLCRIAKCDAWLPPPYRVPENNEEESQTEISIFIHDPGDPATNRDPAETQTLRGRSDYGQNGIGSDWVWG